MSGRSHLIHTGLFGVKLIAFDNESPLTTVPIHCCLHGVQVLHAHIQQRARCAPRRALAADQ